MKDDRYYGPSRKKKEETKIKLNKLFGNSEIISRFIRKGKYGVVKESRKK